MWLAETYILLYQIISKQNYLNPSNRYLYIYHSDSKDLDVTLAGQDVGFERNTFSKCFLLVCAWNYFWLSCILYLFTADKVRIMLEYTENLCCWPFCQIYQLYSMIYRLQGLFYWRLCPFWLRTCLKFFVSFVSHVHTLWAVKSQLLSSWPIRSVCVTHLICGRPYKRGFG